MRRLFLAAVFALVVLFAANHVEFHLHTRKMKEDEGAEKKGISIPVRMEAGEDDHLRLAVDEERLALSVKEPVLRFSSLRKWEFDPLRTNPPPAALAGLDGRKVVAAGFMLARGEEKEAKVFSLVRAHHPGHHDHAPASPLQPGEHIRVEMMEKVRIEKLRPVLVRGRFLIEPNPDAGALYRIEGESVEAAGTGKSGSRRGEDASGLPAFDYFWLEELEFQETRGREFRFPEGLLALDGKRILVEGFVVDRDEGPPRAFMLGEFYWDGCCSGVRPSYFNSVLVLPREEEPIPPPWIEKGAYAGTLKLSLDDVDWSKMGIARIEDARARAVPKRSGPYIPVWVEAIALALVVLAGAGLTWLRPSSGGANGEKS